MHTIKTHHPNRLNRLKTRPARLLAAAVLRGLLLLSLTLPAHAAAGDNLVVSGSAVTESGTSHLSNGQYYAAVGISDGGSYSGSNVTLTGTYSEWRGYPGQYALSATGAQSEFHLYDSVLTTTGTNTNGGSVAVRMSGSSTGWLHNTLVNTEGPLSAAITMAGSSTLTVAGGTVSTQGNSSGIELSGFSSAQLERVTIAPGTGYGLRLNGTSAVTMTGGGIAVEGNYTYGTYIENASTAEFNDANMSVGGFGGGGFRVVGLNASLTVTGGTITASGTHVHAVAVLSGAAGRLENVTAVVTSEGDRAGLIAESRATLTVLGGSISTSGSGVPAVRVSSGGTASLTGAAIVATGEGAAGIEASDVYGTGSNAVEVNGGTVNAARGAGINISGSTAGITITGGAEISGTAALLVTGAKPTEAHVAVTGTSALNGGVSAENSTNLRLEVSDHAILNGDVTGSGSATLDVTLTGPGSALLGDVFQNDDAAVTLTLNDGATGTGGFTGGNLHVLDPGSAWSFNKNSTLHAATNAGTLNIGTHAVTFGNLHHTGTLHLAVDTDTGAGGRLTITGTATGDGTLHIATTGGGALDPNDTLDGKIIGAGTEHWSWDDLAWGLEEYTYDSHIASRAVPGEKTPHFIQTAASPAGAVLNSAIVLQQAMWFAQNDTLHQRLGDLRLLYNSHESQASHNSHSPAQPHALALWIRAHAQHLNLSSAIAGRAYTQRLYGIDLGADYRFPLAGGATLHTGLYLGHARATADYKTPGHEAELTSTHGGVYATLIRDNGLHLDATLKIASVDNTLETLQGAAPCTADYKNLNLGASLELGWRCPLQNNWHIEPALQLGYLRILAKDYTAGPMRIAASDMDALQARLTHTLGKTIPLAGGGVLQPYARLGGAVLTSHGGEIRNGYQRLRPAIDGARIEAGLGAIWQLSAAHQLHFDYEASYAEKYNKPWGLTAGYRWQF